MEVMLLGTSRLPTSQDSVTCHTQLQGRLENFKSQRLRNLLPYYSKLGFEYHASPKLQMWTRKWSLFGNRRKILWFGSATNYMGMVISLVMVSSSSKHHQAE